MSGYEINKLGCVWLVVFIFFGKVNFFMVG